MAVDGDTNALMELRRSGFVDVESSTCFGARNLADYRYDIIIRNPADLLLPETDDGLGPIDVLDRDLDLVAVVNDIEDKAVLHPEVFGSVRC
jgi:hypothetical protein